ncbi:MAG: hypothetical protein FJZ86_18245 [Chloroflexi bacterium]|nr:hypothetical protein [Chloroflexota bacterium]
MSYTKLSVFFIATVTLLLTACGGGQANTNGAVDVEVVLGESSAGEFTVQSSVTEFKPDVQYQFVVTNKGQIPHEFMIIPITENMNMSAMSMEEKDAQALMIISEEELPPGATVEMDYTFTNIPEGNIEFVCALPGHFEAGMHTPITVK